MEITGILIKKISEREGVSRSTGNKWKTAGFLFEIPGEYPRNIAFTVRDGQTGRIAFFETMLGKAVIVSFGIDAHEYEGRWFNEVNAYGVRDYVEKSNPDPINGGFGPSDPIKVDDDEKEPF